MTTDTIGRQPVLFALKVVGLIVVLPTVAMGVGMIETDSMMTEIWIENMWGASGVSASLIGRLLMQSIVVMLVVEIFSVGYGRVRTPDAGTASTLERLGGRLCPRCGEQPGDKDRCIDWKPKRRLI